MNYQVLLYYKFVKVEDPESLRIDQEEFCAANNLLGRILIGEEGINGTVSGLTSDTQAYMEMMHAHSLFNDIEFKVDPHQGHTFNKLHVRVKEEVIRFEAGEIDLHHQKGKYVEPEDWRKILKQAETDENIVILDTRSDYEYKVGKFKNAIALPIGNFRELPQKLEALSDLKGKKIYTYCTGGIRCEKVTLLMEKEGFEEVYQLHGGIIRYGHETGGEDFEGGCYVFDQRVVVPVNSVNPTVVGKCEVCSGPTEKMINCANPDCNRHFLICVHCATELEGSCSQTCMESPRKRQFDGRGYYLRGENSKLYAHNPDPNYLRKLEQKD